MIAFGMKTTLVRFQGKYYNYKGVVGNGTVEASEDNNDLAIGAFEVAFCADTGATFAEKRQKKQSGGSVTSNSRLTKWSEGPSFNSPRKFATHGKLNNYQPLMKRSPPMDGTSGLK
eukprot:2766062-Ditylum_brightwellii.AAC.1